jgi:hypothetical protein
MTTKRFLSIFCKNYRQIQKLLEITINKHPLPEEFNLDLETTDFPSTASIVEDTDDDKSVDAIGC